MSIAHDMTDVCST